MNRARNKTLSLALALCMVFSLFTALPTTAQAADYADRMALGTWNGDGTNPGDGHRYITFGSYNGHNLVWRVLEVYESNGTTTGDDASTGDKVALLLLDDVLRDNDGAVEPRQFDDTSNDWNTSDICTWLNNDFYSAAFDGSEQVAVVTSSYQYGGTYYHGSYGGSTTGNSKVFLLSVDEAGDSRYFDNNADRTMPSGVWWLRSPGSIDSYASRVYGDGSVFAIGFQVILNYGIRPALKINLESGIFTSSEISYGVTVQIVDGSSDIAGARVSLSAAPDAKFSDSNGRAAFGRFSAGVELTLAVEKAGYVLYTENFTVGEGELLRSVTLTPDDSLPDRVYFGQYGGNPILWRVLDLDRAGGRVLLLADDVITSAAFHSSDDSTWSTSDIRGWLNGDDSGELLHTGNFTTAEAAAILTTELSDVGTDDKLFLLSYDEAGYYLPDNAMRAASASWWLRTAVGANLRRIDDDGSKALGLVSAASAFLGVRPAMWVDLNKLTLSGGDTLSADTLHSAAVTVTDGANPIDGAAVTLSTETTLPKTAARNDVVLTAATSGGTGAAFTLPAGEYDVAVTAYGYQNGSGTLTVASGGANTAEITLTVTDITKPTVSVSPDGVDADQSATNLVLTFSEEIDISSGGTVTMSPDKITGSPDYTSADLWSDGNKVLTIPLDALDYDTVYTVDVSGFKDLAGNEMDAVSGHTFNTEVEPVSPPPEGGTTLPPSGGTTTPQQPTAKIGDVDVNYNIGSDGTVTLKPTPEQLEKLLATISTDGVLRIAVSGINGMKSAVIEIDLSKLTASDKLQVFNFSVLGMELRFPVGSLESMQKLAKTLRFGLKPGSLIFELTDTGGKAVNWYDYANPVTVSMAYEPPQDISTHQVVMTRKNGEIIPRSWYSGGRVFAKVSAPGTFDAAVKPLGSFTDTSGLWMNEAVGYMSARGIAQGVGGGLFDRGGTITKAHFVTMLMRALAVEAQADDDALPADYADAPEWARAHIASAAALGITLEDENGNFNPGAAITRQDMFFMAYQAMQSCGMLPDAITMQFIIFSDWDDITDEYGGALQTLAILGLVKGYGDGTLNPNGSSTRAEGAQFLYNILKFDAK